MDYMLLTIFLLCIMLIISYRSKTDKSKIVAVLFTIFGSIGIGSLLFLVYQEKVVVGNDWLRFIGISFMMIAMLFSEVLDVFQLIPDLSKKQLQNKNITSINKMLFYIQNTSDLEQISVQRKL